MKQFVPLLKKINEKLDLPQPIKSKIILEMAADLENLYEAYLEKGYSEEDTFQKVCEKYDDSDKALAELAKIHESGYRKILAKVSEQAQTRWERIVLVMVMLFLAVMSFKVVITTRFLSQASNFIWPILGIFLVVLILSLHKFYTIYIKKDHRIRKLRTGLPTIMFLGSSGLLIGIGGYFYELYSAGSNMMYSGLPGVLITIIEKNDNLFFFSVERILKCSSMAMVCVFVTIFIALIWFFLMNKIINIEMAEAVCLLED